MKSKKSRSIGIIAGLALVVLAVFFAFKPEGKEEVKPQTKIEQVTKDEVRIAKAKVRQRPTPQPVEVTLGGFKSGWDNEK